ncbi:DUF7305 domain-containing protein [Phosphitispora fastidiosa]|uniref:DUF7305 domain-containing protein n=1 Tax=Phosphitispora fastidiosa TaxID=2837202 RepID=UPI001E291459|nr:PilX N-terminal domain-containing pilus assembly protein [Phosphitispora fastidiosa]MBU7008768.1 cytoskeletal protein CcmA (bactofilin family) [Phosphitispora fastidiosa]
MGKLFAKSVRVFNKTDGSALILVLLVVTMLLILGTAAINISTDKTMVTHLEADGMQALYTAESAVNINKESGGVVYDAVYEYLTDSSYTFGSPVSGTASGGEYRIVSVSRQGPTIFKAVVESELPGTAVKRKITATFEAVYSLGSGYSGVFDYAIFSNGDMTMEGQANTDSTPNPVQGDIRSNGGIYLSGQAEVNGDAYYMSGISGGDKVVGDSIPLNSDDSLDMPEIPEEWVDVINYNFYTTTESGDVSYSNDEVENLTQRYIAGNLSISGTAEVTITGIILVDGDVSISGQSKVTGDGVILAKKTVNLSGQSDAVLDFGAIISLSDNSSGANPAIAASGQNDSRCVIYAPNGMIKLSGQGDITGSVVGNSVLATGQGTILHDQNLAASYTTLPGSGTGTGGVENLSLKIIGWQEN